RQRQRRQRRRVDRRFELSEVLHLGHRLVGLLDRCLLHFLFRLDFLFVFLLSRAVVDQLDALADDARLRLLEEQEASEEKENGMDRGRGDEPLQCALHHFFSVEMPTLEMPIFRASSKTATTFLKSASPAAFTTTFGSFCDALSVWSLKGSCAVV